MQNLKTVISWEESRLSLSGRGLVQFNNMEVEVVWNGEKALLQYEYEQYAICNLPSKPASQRTGIRPVEDTKNGTTTKIKYKKIQRLDGLDQTTNITEISRLP